MKKYVLDDVNMLFHYSDYQIIYINNNHKLTVVNFDNPKENPFYNERKK